MRVTQSMLTNNMLRNLSDSYGKLGKFSEQVNTGKKITRPSDDPVVAMKGIDLRTNLKEVQQYERNFSEAHNMIENSESALYDVTKALGDVRELVTQAANGPLDDEQRKYIGEEIKGIRDYIEGISNTKVGNKFIFNGTDTLRKPVDLAAGTYPEQGQQVKVELSKGILIDVSVDVSDIFGAEGLFKDLNEIVAKLENGTTGEEIGTYITNVENQADKVLSAMAGIGALTNRIELMEDRVEHQAIIAEKMMSDNENVDFEVAITNLITQETLHRAALGVGSRIMQPTLLDFLR